MPEPSNSSAEALTLNVRVSGGGACGRQLGSDEVMRVRPPYGAGVLVTRGRAPSSLCYVRAEQEDGRLHAGRWALTKIPAMLAPPRLPTSRAVRNKYLPSKPPSLPYFVMAAWADEEQKVSCERTVKRFSVV